MTVKEVKTMDKLLSREVVLTVLCSISFTALILEIVQCVTVGLTGGIPEEEAEDESCD